METTLTAHILIPLLAEVGFQFSEVISEFKLLFLVYVNIDDLLAGAWENHSF